MNVSVSKRSRFLNYEFPVPLILGVCSHSFKCTVAVLLGFKRLDAYSSFYLFLTAPLYRDMMTPELNFRAL